MNPRVPYGLLIGALLLAGIVLLPAPTVAAQDQGAPVIQRFEQQDLDGDGKPELATIMAEFQNEPFRILVYDQGTDMEWSEDWQTGTDFLNDVWLFQAESSKETKLIIRFAHSQEGYLAELYDDFNEDKDVAYRVQDSARIEILESSFPTMHMTAEQPWVLPGEKVNYMVYLSLRRPLPVAHMQPIFWPYLPQDGDVSYENEVIDSDHDGEADYELSQAFPNLPLTVSAHRSMIKINLSGALQDSFYGAFLWPYLGSEKWIQTPPGYLRSPIRVDWQTARIVRVGAFLPTWGLGNQWMILTTKPIEKDTINELDWEVFAYYDFDGDTITDVLFRLIHQPVTPVQIASRSYHLEQVSFAWRQQERNEVIWDYELEVAGLHELPSTEVEFQDFAVYAVPYEDLLQHFSRPSDWAYATFIAAESNAYGGNEGIWEWGTLEGIQTDIGLPPEDRIVPGAMGAQHYYLRGLSDHSPADLYTEIREGFRGEYADLMGPASLYLSPIDRRLHLLGAQKGVWNLGHGREIQYENLNGVYLDAWILLDNGEPVKYLYAPPGYLLYQDRDGMQLFQADVAPALFTTAPPRDRAEWEDLNRKIEELDAGFAPDDFLSMARQSGEPRLVISAASFRAFRLTADGYRFVLSLEPGFSLPNKDPLGLHALAPGDYVVTLSGSTLSVQPLTPAQPRVVPGTLRISDPNPLAFESLRLEASLYNAGLDDQPDLPVRAYVAGPGADWQPIDTITITLLAGQYIPVRFVWTPTRPGEWRLALDWGEEGEQPLSASALDPVALAVPVTASPKLPVGWILRLSHVSQPLALGAFLGALVCVATSLALVILRKAKEPS